MSLIPQLERSSVAAVAMAALLLAALAWLALQYKRTPPARGLDVPGSQFAAGRALPALQFLTQAPRPIASEANARARRYLVAYLNALGLPAEVQTASARHSQLVNLGFNHTFDLTLGVIHNVVVRVKGNALDRERRPALLIASHYDSMADRVGAADASIAIAAMLETARALQYGTPPENDVIFLFADGEKAGALGTRAFAEQHRWARRVGVVLHFDAAGNSGPLLPTGSRGGDGQLIKAWAQAAPLAQGNSILPLLAAHMPGMREGSPLDRLGSAGLRFANIDGAPGASGRLDLREHVSSGTLQHTGDTMLAMARRLGATPLAGIGAPDRVHFDLPFVGQVHYGTDMAWPFTRLALFIFLVLCCVAVNRANLELRLVLAGALTLLAITGGMAVLALTMWKELPSLHRAYQPIVNGAGARDPWYLLAYLAFGTALFIEVQRRLHKAIGLSATVMGAMLLTLILLACASHVAPGASYLLAWPMIGAMLAYGVLFIQRVGRWPPAARLLILLLGAAPAVLLFAPVIEQLATLYTPQRSAVLMLTLGTLLGLAGALLANLRRRFVAPLLLALCGWSLATAARTPQYDGRFARPNQMTYLKDTYSWKAWWTMPAAPLDDWSRPYFGATLVPRSLREVFGKSEEELWVAPAPRNHIAFPDVMTLKDVERDGRRTVAFSVRSRNNAPTIVVRVADANTLAARLDGKPLSRKLSKMWSLTLHGRGGRENVIELDLEPDSMARVYIEERIPGLPGEAGKPRPGYTRGTGMTVASDMLVFR